ncbi:serine/threonine protein kinase [Leptolyngbya sp. 7M]|uniref:serine/threonine protein kinase n=1 Tax=Leptolyngbya sp. 7M TaxID=2812896 RepID=UPI001B8B0FBD|nr:serine/threonine-protein kinase [Leptolyngbya sp. 7M]QYO65733.1 serine/threonine protein kinase [Leptolyngbya sp. 7M]
MSAEGNNGQLIGSGHILQGRYQITEKIGQGGMGAVYVAVDQRFGSTVAIKQTLCMDDNYRKAIEREARLLNSLKHSALPRVSDHFVENNGQFLVMEFIPGEDLCCILDDQAHPFEPKLVLKWADQLLDALEFLHNQENPVIHRDIKPQNLKLTPKGQIVLLDFGLAKGNPTESNNKTAAKSIFGYSRNYASLEQIQGTGTEPRSDLYSLAATLYHLMTGVPPEDALTRAMAVLSKKPDPLRPAHIVEPKVPKGVSAILYRAMDLDVAMRPESAVEMRDMLRDHVQFEHLDLHYSGDAVSEQEAKLHSQPTRLMPAATHQGGNKLTEAKTRLLTDEASLVTEVRPNAEAEGKTSVETSSPKRFAFAAGGLGLLLLGWAVVGGVYFYGPGSFVESELPIPADTVPEPETAAPKDDASGVSIANTSVSENAWSHSAAPESKRDPVAADKESRTSAQTNAASANADEAAKVRIIQTEAGQIIIDGNTIIMGDKKIVGSKLITPQGEFDLQEPPIVPRPRLRPGDTPPNLEDLTPEQRRRVIQTMRRFEGNIRPIPPRPPRPEN